MGLQWHWDGTRTGQDGTRVGSGWIPNGTMVGLGWDLDETQVGFGVVPGRHWDGIGSTQQKAEITQTLGFTHAGHLVGAEGLGLKV